MADSLPDGDDASSLPEPIVRQKTGPKGAQSALSVDIKLKLAEIITNEFEKLHVVLISGKRNQANAIEDILQKLHEYMVPVTISKVTLKRWLSECVKECLLWEEEYATEEKDGGSKKSGQDNIQDEPHKLAWVQLMRDVREQIDRAEHVQRTKKQKFNFAPKSAPSVFPAPRPSIAGAAAPTESEIIDIDSVVCKEGCEETLALALQAVDARKSAGQASGKLNYKSPPPRPDMCAEILAAMRAREERDNGMFADVRRSMAYDRLENAERRLDRAVSKNDEAEIARAQRALDKIRDEIDGQ